MGQRALRAHSKYKVMMTVPVVDRAAEGGKETPDDAGATNQEVGRYRSWRGRNSVDANAGLRLRWVLALGQVDEKQEFRVTRWSHYS